MGFSEHPSKQIQHSNGISWLEVFIGNLNLQFRSQVFFLPIEISKAAGYIISALALFIRRVGLAPRRGVFRCLHVVNLFSIDCADLRTLPLFGGWSAGLLSDPRTQKHYPHGGNVL